MGIDESIEALTETLERAGVDPPTAPAEPPDWDAIAAEIEPMSLPADVRRWWERVDPWTMRAWAYPEPIRWDFALDTWIQHRDEFPAIAPRSLFLVGYTSWACMSVELDSPLSPGGALFEWRLEDGGYYLRHHDFSAWLDRIAGLVAAGEFERRESPAGPRLLLKDPHTSLPLNHLPGPGTPNPVHGDVTRYERDPLLWPVHWQRLSGIEADDIEPRGATHSIADVLSSDPSASLEATITAEVIDLAGWGGNTRVRVSDGTGEMAINCPTAVTMLGPGMRQEFEFDVVVPAGERRIPPNPSAVPELADPAQHISQTLLARYGGPATAVATAVRPLRRLRLT